MRLTPCRQTMLLVAFLTFIMANRLSLRSAVRTLLATETRTAMIAPATATRFSTGMCRSRLGFRGIPSILVDEMYTCGRDGLEAPLETCLEYSVGGGTEASRLGQRRFVRSDVLTRKPPVGRTAKKVVLHLMRFTLLP